MIVSHYNNLVKNHEKPKENFINSLKFRKNGFKLIDVLEIIDSRFIKYTIESGFDFESDNSIENNFTVMSLIVNDIDDVKHMKILLNSIDDIEYIINKNVFTIIIK